MTGIGPVEAVYLLVRQLLTGQPLAETVIFQGDVHNAGAIEIVAVADFDLGVPDIVVIHWGNHSEVPFCRVWHVATQPGVGGVAVGHPHIPLADVILSITPDVHKAAH